MERALMSATRKPQPAAATEQLGGPLPTVLQPEDGVSFWRPRPTNGHVTVKTSPSYGGPPGITMGTQTIPAGCFVAESCTPIGRLAVRSRSTSSTIVLSVNPKT